MIKNAGFDLGKPSNYKLIVFVIIVFALLGGSLYYYLTIKNTAKNANEDKDGGSSDLINLGANYFSSLGFDSTDSTIPNEASPIVATKVLAKIPTPSIKKKYKPKHIKVKSVDFNKSFKNKYADTSQLNHAIKRYLLKSNKATNDIKTFIPFEQSTQTLQKNIKTGYSELLKKTDATYFTDFSRVITVDRYISALLISDINSSLAGQVIAQVDRNVYAAHGDNILIPVGSKIIGSYEPVAKIGDTRLDINWNRIITPRGINIVVGLKTTDATGKSGLSGNLDNRYSDRYGLSLLVSTINAAALLSIKTTNDQAVFINTFGRELTQVTGKILEDNINIKPVITIPHGTRILVRAIKDIWFRDADGVIKVESFNFNKKG